MLLTLLMGGCAALSGLDEFTLAPENTASGEGGAGGAGSTTSSAGGSDGQGGSGGMSPCGNGVRDPGEECDASDPTSTAECSATCEVDCPGVPFAELPQQVGEQVFLGERLGAESATLGEPGCGTPVATQKVYKYTTGSEPAALFVEVTPASSDGLTYPMVWAYSQCADAGSMAPLACDNQRSILPDEQGARIHLAPVEPYTPTFFVVSAPSAVVGSADAFDITVVEAPGILLEEHRFEGELGVLQTEDLKSGGSAAQWVTASQNNDTSSQSGSGYVSIDDPGGTGNDTVNVALVTLELNCSGYSQLFVEFDHYYDDEGPNPGDRAVVEVTADMSTWDPLDEYTDGDDQGRRTLKIGPCEDDPASNFSIRFAYDDADGTGQFWHIDDLIVYGY
jgi:hypothetical protein